MKCLPDVVLEVQLCTPHDVYYTPWISGLGLQSTLRKGGAAGCVQARLRVVLDPPEIQGYYRCIDVYLLKCIGALWKK
jgi:hypothetical protein